MIGGYLERLKSDFPKMPNQGTVLTAKSHTEFPETGKVGTAKTAISPFDSFGSSHVGHFQKFNAPPKPSPRQPTNTEAAELRALIRACGEPYGFTESDYQEATERALADADAALLCYRAMAKAEHVNVATRPEPGDDRVTCLTCANLNEFQVCRVAHPWTPATACAPARRPVVDLLRRCDGLILLRFRGHPINEG